MSLSKLTSFSIRERQESHCGCTTMTGTMSAPPAETPPGCRVPAPPSGDLDYYSLVIVTLFLPGNQCKG
ncbi:hypothetical protein CRENBAI_003351 [Crenichthys baileyi]|uniref:Uncharacterized protein n=1 Tax=Crenichthys baileyi TaxID=28760 RepID=A0AAV9RKV4_9TELE